MRQGQGVGEGAYGNGTRMSGPVNTELGNGRATTAQCPNELRNPNFCVECFELGISEVSATGAKNKFFRRFFLRNTFLRRGKGRN